jgi:hypothetical protein
MQDDEPVPLAITLRVTELKNGTLRTDPSNIIYLFRDGRHVNCDTASVNRWTPWGSKALPAILSYIDRKNTLPAGVVCPFQVVNNRRTWRIIFVVPGFESLIGYSQLGRMLKQIDGIKYSIVLATPTYRHYVTGIDFSKTRRATIQDLDNLQAVLQWPTIVPVIDPNEIKRRFKHFVDTTHIDLAIVNVFVNGVFPVGSPAPVLGQSYSAPDQPLVPTARRRRRRASPSSDPSIDIDLASQYISLAASAWSSSSLSSLSSLSSSSLSSLSSLSSSSLSSLSSLSSSSLSS